jgi:hypothetical protein
MKKKRGNTKKQVAETRKQMETNIFRLLTYKQIEAVMTPEAFDAFCSWMRGQTCMLDENGECLVYPWDLERWVHGGIRRQQTLAEWD